MALSEIQSEHQRLVILRCLAEVPGFQLNESILHDSLNRAGVPTSRDAVKMQLEWLREMGLVKITQMASFYVAELTGRGADVVSGVARVPGIKVPRPGG
ncbi:VpaChn25_0724 family phage protein [Photobacterium atrarenae]|uniref:ArsR family transcriptional regulator n=1 Tax=Photobacterium atrarenae TaxID=865757 RepID=A0ABY5GNQ0_9GAMM|nr:ArsR family transcriptional regulator [Photobacterium atrarenae]UTV30177.1 ArsR family transcriptional regulator [Photobacterium atrarenae]